MIRWIVGPTLERLAEIGLNGRQVVLSTGTYSRRPLLWVAQRCTASSAVFMGRLDLNDPRDWINGSLDPRGLLDCIRLLGQSGVRTRVMVSPVAHAKIYVGSRGVLTGSANLSLRGFGAGPEIVTFHDRTFIPRALRIVAAYSRQLEEIDLETLEDYVHRYQGLVRRQRPRGTVTEDRLPPIRIQSQQTRVGSYADFLAWCRRLGNPAAEETADRAAGKGNLSGHIHRNFYGIRQYLIAFPEEKERLTAEDPTRYRVFGDPGLEQRLLEFVRESATDEPDFSLDIWQTFLPRELGGRAGKRGGTIGNLNRMFPLVALYLESR